MFPYFLETPISPMEKENSFSQPPLRWDKPIILLKSQNGAVFEPSKLLQEEARTLVLLSSREKMVTSIFVWGGGGHQIPTETHKKVAVFFFISIKLRTISAALLFTPNAEEIAPKTSIAPKAPMNFCFSKKPAQFRTAREIQSSFLR